MNEQQLKEAFMQYLMEKSGAQTEQEFEAYVQQLGEEGIRQEYAQFMQMVQQQQVASRKFGGMLNYIGKLRGICPEGQEMQFFKKGGQVCKKCVQKIKMQDGGTTPQNAVEEFKCGRKMKRKAACGTKLPKDKCGSKVEMDKCGKKMPKKLKGGNVGNPYKNGVLKRVTSNAYLNPNLSDPQDTLYNVIYANDGDAKYDPSILGLGYNFGKGQWGDSVAIELPRRASGTFNGSPVYKSENPAKFRELSNKFNALRNSIKRK